jgi:hypothetical protein
LLSCQVSVHGVGKKFVPSVHGKDLTGVKYGTYHI